MYKYLPFIIITIMAIFGSVGQLLFKKSAGIIDIKQISTIIGNIWLIMGLSLYGLATIGYIYALKYGELSVLYPLIATSYIWVLILSVIFLHEKMNLSKIIGSSGIILCVWLIVR